MSRRAHRTARPRVGLALAGGGPLGGIYEIGALLALAESLDGIDLNELDVYVGVSSGGAALIDPRPLSIHAPAVRTAARDLVYTLDLLERWLHRSRRLPRGVQAAAAR
jgi:hypothetical protein